MTVKRESDNHQFRAYSVPSDTGVGWSRSWWQSKEMGHGITVMDWVVMPL